MVKNKQRSLSTQDDRISHRFKTHLQEFTPLRRLVVFGSRARGTATSDSDLDMFIEVPALDAGLRRQISKVAWEISLDEGVIISTFVVTTEAITNGPQAANPILHTIELEGIVV